jgi:Zn-finger nucleic acid-binding protein
MSVYREQAGQRTVLFCPRCNELLDQVDFGVDICPRCEGFWIGSSVLELSGNQWPGGAQVWWRREVRCPMCATQGVVTVMNARTSNDVIVDQCFAHGVWLDRGELSRVMRDPVVKGLTKLREHLAALEPSPEDLVLRRERWHGEQEDRARLAVIERKRIESERTKRAEEAKQTEAQRAEDRRRAAEEKLREAERLAEARRADDQRAKAARADLERQHAELRIEQDRAAIAEAERARRSTDPDLAQAAELARQRAADLEQRGREAAEWQRRREEAQVANASHLEREQRLLQNRVDYLVVRIDSLRHELTETQDSLAKARSDLAATTKRIDETIE